MSKLFVAIMLTAFTFTACAADTDNQTDGAELGTNETPQAQEQTKNSSKTMKRQTGSKKHSHSTKNMKTKAKPSGSSENNPLQPTEPETAPGAAH